MPFTTLNPFRGYVIEVLEGLIRDMELEVKEHEKKGESRGFLKGYDRAIEDIANLIYKLKED